MFKDVTTVILVVLALLVALFAGCHGCANVQVSEGFRDSEFRKLSTTGVIWPTHEAEFLGQGMRAGMESETFKYTVQDTQVLAILQAAPPGSKFRVHYVKKGIADVRWVPNGETNYFITRVEPVK